MLFRSGPTLLQFGTDEQRHRFLPDIIAGTSKWCVGMSEPDAGSDVASLRTRADRDGDHWVLNGQKVWTSGAAESDWCYVIARTDPDAAPHAGLSEFIVDLHSPGVEIRTIHDMSDDRHFCEVHFSDVRVPADLQVGTLNGAFKQIMRQMEHERGGIDRLVSNRRLYLDAVASAHATGRLASDPLLRQEYARLEGGYRIGRSLVLREVLGQAPPGYSAVTKTWCTEFEQRVLFRRAMEGELSRTIGGISAVRSARFMAGPGSGCKGGVVPGPQVARKAGGGGTHSRRRGLW